MRSAYQAWVEVLPDFSSFGRRVDTGVTSSLGAAGTAGAATFGRNFTAGVAALGIGAVVAGAIGAGVRYASDGIQLASGLAEQVNAVQVAYGDVGDEILAVSRLAPQNLNITQAAFNRLAVRFSGVAAKIAGDGGDVAAVVRDLTQRGADFASVYDLEASEALELFQSGLAGETEPLRRFGIDLSAASVNAYAYAQGIAEAGTQLTDVQKAQATYGLLMEKTEVTAGDLANTSGSLANQQRELNTAFEEAQTKFGTALLPGFTTLVSYLNSDVLPKLDEVITKISPDVNEALAEIGPAIESVLPLIGEQIGKLSGEASDFARILAGDLGGVLDDNWNEFLETNKDSWAVKAIEGLFGSNEATDELFAEWDQVGKDSAGAYGSGVDSGLKAFNFWETGKGAADEAATGAGAQAFAFWDAGSDLADGLGSGIRNGKARVVGEAAAVAEAALTAIKGKLRIASPSKAMEELGAFATEGFALGLEKNLSAVAASASSISTATMASVAPAGEVGAAQFPRELTLVVDGRPMAAYIAEGADARVGEYDRSQSVRRDMGSRGF